MKLLARSSVNKTVRMAVLAAIGLLAGGCAEIAPPPGGEADRTPPELMMSDPPNGAVGVVPDREITLVFSEDLLKPSKGTGIFVSPRPIIPPKVKWKSDRITIDLGEAYIPDQTYVVSVGSDVTDLRRNRLDSAISIAFSTGLQIDSGAVGGEVLTAEGKPAGGWAVGLYPDLGFPDAADGDSVYPAYLTSSNQQGRFSLRYLPEGEYRLLAFNDKNRDELFNPIAEEFGLPDRRVVVGADLALDHLVMPATKYDSLVPQLLSAVGTGDGLIRVRLGKPIDMTYLALRPEGLTLRPIGADGTVLAAAAVLEADLDETSVLTAYFPNLADGTYGLSIEYAPESPPLDHDSLVFKRGLDKVPPTVIDFRPGGQPLFVHQAEIKQTFSEPLDTTGITDQTFFLWESDSLPIPLARTWQDCFRLTLEPERLQAGRQYRLDVAEFDLTDLAGNKLGDSLRSYRFSTLDNDSLGSISGEVVVRLRLEREPPAVLTFRNTADSREFHTSVEFDPDRAEGRTLPFDLEVPPGKYLLSGFLDSNRDGEPTSGGIRPVRLAETQAVHPDTIAVRARFETAGIELVFD